MAPDRCPPLDLLQRLLADTLPAGELAAVDAHLGRCPDCRAALDALTDFSSAVGPALTPPPVGPNGPLPSVPGYEFRRLLGRGGLGAVYLARDVAAGREVAVKLLRAGAAAGPEERSRMRADAAALARLSHPNVVTLFAVGEHAGQPYLVMEHLPGGSLAGGGWRPPREAAALLAAAADGVEHAHRHGILHRDLKPANVLLAADGTPKVADFGMGKGAPADGDPTPTGVAVGTPAYMAPELAFGRHRQAGPPADVYGLGAVGYELVTGRPPFQGATPYDTLIQVRSQDPSPPRSLRHDLPRDLETVLLKCLEKEPGRRYPSAAALAADLRRFLAGRPVVARPVGPLGRARRWAGRHPSAAAPLGLMAVLLAGSLVGLAALWRRAEGHAATAERRLDTTRQALRAYMAQAERRFWNPKVVTADERADLERAFDLQAELAAEYPDDPAARFAAGYAMLQIADITGRLGDCDGAHGKSTQALAVIRRAAADAPAERWFRAGLAEACMSVAHWRHRAGQPADDLELEAVRLAREVAAEEPTRDHYRGLHAAFSTTWGARLRDLGRPADALPVLAEAADVCRRLAAKYPGDPVRRCSLAGTLARLASVAARVDDTPARTEAALREAIDQLEATQNSHPDRPTTYQDLPGLRLTLAFLLANTGRREAARTEADRAVADAADLAAAHPALPYLAQTRDHLAERRDGMDRPDLPAARLAALAAAADAAEQNGLTPEAEGLLGRALVRWRAGDRAGARADLERGAAAARGDWLTGWDVWRLHDHAWAEIDGRPGPPRRPPG